MYDVEKIIKTKGKLTTEYELLKILSDEIVLRRNDLLKNQLNLVTDVLSLDMKLLAFTKEKTRMMIHDKLMNVAEKYLTMCSVIEAINHIKGMVTDPEEFNIWYLVDDNNRISFYIERKDIDNLIKAEEEKINANYI